MEVEYMVLADAAEVAGDKHYLFGGGFDNLWATHFPAMHPRLAVAIKVSIPYLETAEPHTFQLDMLDQDGHSVLPEPFDANFASARPPGMRAGDDQSLVTVLNIINLQIPAPGPYRVVCRLDGAVDPAASQRFTAQLNEQ